MIKKTDLITALQTRYPLKESETTAQYVTRLEKQVNAPLEQERIRIQQRLDNLAINARAKLKEEALSIIAEQNKVQFITENSTINI